MRTKVSRPLSSTCQRWGYFGVLVGFVLVASGCGVNLTKGRYDPSQIPTSGGGSSFMEGAVDKAATPPPAEDMLPSLSASEQVILVLRCEPKSSEETTHEPLVRSNSLGEYNTYLQSLPSTTREEVLNKTAVVLKRMLSVEIQGESKEVPLSYLIPMKLFQILAPTGETAPIAHLLYQIGLPLPAELFAYFLEQSMVPQFDNPEVYAKNKEILLRYLKFSKDLQDQLRSEQKTPEELKASLGIQGLKPEAMAMVLAYAAMPTNLENENVLAVIFISPDYCRYQTPMEVGLPLFDYLVRRLTVVEPGEVIDRLWAKLNIQFDGKIRWLICPSPSPSPGPVASPVSPQFPVGGGCSRGKDAQGKNIPCDPKELEGVGK